MMARTLWDDARGVGGPKTQAVLENRRDRASESKYHGPEVILMFFFAP